LAGAVQASGKTMDAEKIRLVKDSWVKIKPLGATAADLFYARLFAIAPHVRPLFKENIRAQGKKFMDMINLIVVDLDRIEELVPELENLARRHTNYGVVFADYDAVRESLIWAFEQILKNDFTPAVRSTWTEAYEVVANIMKAAA
jgi:hemoglobin-like flavoprotein